jgi:hypothetical protein
MSNAVASRLFVPVALRRAGSVFPKQTVGVSDRPLSKRTPRPRVTAGQGCFAFEWMPWGGWGSNPRPADYESAALTC